MPFSRPPLRDLIEQTQADIDSRLGTRSARLRRSVLGALGRVWAGALHGLYGYGAWIARQILPDTADEEWLKRHASIRGMSAKGAEKAVGNVTLTGEDGSTLEAGAEMQRADGRAFVTTEDVTLDDGAKVSVEAVEAGADGNTDEGVELELVESVSGVDSTATVADGDLVGGTDAEDTEALRERLLDQLRRPTKGGGPGDYRSWALEVPGVTRAWETPLAQGGGTVSVRVMTDEATSDGIPVDSKVDEVQDYLDERAHVTAEVYALAPIADPLDPSIRIYPNTSEIRSEVTAELRAMLEREGEPGGTLRWSSLVDAIGSAAGLEDYRLNEPTDDVTHDTGHIPTLGDPTWQTLD